MTAQILDPGDPRGRPRRRAKVRELQACAARELTLDPALVEIEQLGRQRAVGCGTEAGARRHRCQARLVVLADQGGPGLDRIACQVIEADLGLRVEVGGERHEVGVEQRQPVLHAREDATGLDRLQQRVGGDRAEPAQIAGLERLHRVGVEQHLAHRHQLECRDLALRALGQRIEAADRFQGRAEEVQADRLFLATGKDVDQAAADGVVAGLHDRTGAVVAVALEIGHEPVAIDPRPGLGAQMGRAHPLRRRHLLHDRVGGGQDQALGAPRPGGEPPERPQALGHDPGTGRDPVIGQAVPGRDLDDLDLWREERHHAGQEPQPRAVMGDVEDGRGLAAAQARGEPRGLQPVGRVGQEDGLGPGADATRRIAGNQFDEVAIQHGHALGSKARSSPNTSLSCRGGTGRRS